MIDERYHWPEVQQVRALCGPAVDRLFTRGWEFYHAGNFEVAADLFQAAEELKAHQLQEIIDKGT